MTCAASWEKAKAAAANQKAEGLFQSAKEVDGLKIFTAYFGGTRQRHAADHGRADPRSGAPPGLRCSAARARGKTSMAVSVGREALGRGIKAGALAKLASAITGGNGGGKPGLCDGRRAGCHQGGRGALRSARAGAQPAEINWLIQGPLDLNLIRKEGEEAWKIVCSARLRREKFPPTSCLRTIRSSRSTTLIPKRRFIFLVIPKKHYPSAAALTEADAPLLGHIFAVIADLCAKNGCDKGYRVVTNVGEDGGQSVPHLHFHGSGKAQPEVASG